MEYMVLYSPHDADHTVRDDYVRLTSQACRKETFVVAQTMAKERRVKCTRIASTVIASVCIPVAAGYKFQNSVECVKSTCCDETGYTYACQMFI